MSKPVTITIPHALGAVEARRRLEDGFGKLEQQIAAGGLTRVQKSWSGDRLSFSAQVLGQAVSGRLDVFEEAVRMELDLPEFLAVVAHVIKGRLQKTGRLLLEKK